MIDHHYEVAVTWTGNRGTGTSSYRDYDRDHVVTARGKHDLQGSADPMFRGDRSRWNPEELLVAALAQCHMMSYLYVATVQGFTVVGYEDAATGDLDVHQDHSGRMTGVMLNPVVTILESDRIEDATAAHAEANRLCFIAASVAFPVHHTPEIRIAEAARTD